MERSLLREGVRLLAAMDEVGRGALAGPASVGIVLVDAGVRTAPSGVRDSKLLTPAARERLVPRIRRWALASAVGHASPAEVDEVGILGALRLAARRALATLPATPDLVLLDGNHDWLTDPASEGLLAFAEGACAPSPPVRTRIKADLACSSVAAASVLAKVERDAMMLELAPGFPAYGWAVNKGYATREHLAALTELGACEHHRRSWRLPPYGDGDLDGGLADVLADAAAAGVVVDDGLMTEVS